MNSEDEDKDTPYYEEQQELEKTFEESITNALERSDGCCLDEEEDIKHVTEELMKEFRPYAKTIAGIRVIIGVLSDNPTLAESVIVDGFLPAKK